MILTEEEFSRIFEDVHTRIIEIVTDKADPNAKIWNRDCGDETEKVWLARLKSLDKKKIHCWQIYYKGCLLKGLNDEGVPIGCDVFSPVFSIVGFYEYDFGTDADNSTKRFIDENNRLRYAFAALPQLGFDEDENCWVSSHSGFKEKKGLIKIDDRTVHYSKVDLIVELQPVS